MSNKWEQLERIASPEVVAALKKLNAYFDGRKIAEWAANLYDPEVGGFYYSNSARDNEGYAPDLESTCQILHLLTGNGGYKSSDDALPDDIKQKIVDFVKRRIFLSSSMAEGTGKSQQRPLWPRYGLGLCATQRAEALRKAAVSAVLHTDGCEVRASQGHRRLLLPDNSPGAEARRPKASNESARLLKPRGLPRLARGV